MTASAAWRSVIRIAFTALAVGCALASAAERRVALLIGNNTYNVTPLHNAVNDARDLGAALQALGFTTMVRENATRREMIEALREFGAAIERADAAVFFYAGHALQYKDRNFLLPIDSDVRSEEDIAAFAVEIQLVFDRMERARTRQNVIILDACRDNPFATTFKVASPGLAQSVAPSGTLIAYATAPGMVAADGFGRNGVYTQHILQHIATPDLAVETLFKRVREGVEKQTARRQTPWDASSLKEEFRFNESAKGGEAAPARAQGPTGPSADVQLQIEREFWVSVRDSNRAEELQAYLESYPNGKFVTLARLRLQSLGKPAPPEAPPRSSWLAPQTGWRMIRTQFSGAPAQSAPPELAPPTLDEIFRAPRVADMQISPDGKRIAAIVALYGRQNVVVFDRATKKPLPITNIAQNDVVMVRWLGDNRLLLQTSSPIDAYCMCRLGALLAVDADGGNQRILTDAADGSQVTFRTIVYVRPFPGAPDDFVAQEIVADSTGRGANGALYRVNTRTGRRTQLTLGKPDSGEHEEWIFDEKGTPRVFTTARRGEFVIFYRADANARWEKIGQFKVGGDMWLPIAIARDGKSLYAHSWRGRDKAAIVQIEPRLDAPEQVVASHPYVDVSELIFDAGVPVGIDYHADRHAFAWFDEDLERMQGIADSALPRAVNELSWTRDRNFVLVRSSSDVVPAAFYLFDRANSRIEWWADAQPELKPERLSKMRPVRYRARDGLEIPAFITMPRDKPSKAPLVVLVHDGPWQRHADWSFDAGVQYLASLGYAVLQPNFRGTLGYGYKHFRSSFKQWGRAMQDDISDGIAWALAEGYADKSRVCIVGTGYGGYAALMGLVTSPDLFRCGAAVNALTDIATYIDSPSSPLSRSDMAQYTLREMIGDPASERTDLAKVSPLEQAARIKGAVLLAASPNHVFIPIDHSARMRSALERAGAKPVWLELDGNALGTTRSAKSFHEALARFLADNMAQRN